jgi:hypothetical protein
MTHANGNRPVFVTAELKLAAAMREIGVDAVCGLGGGHEIHGKVENRDAIVVYVGDRSRLQADVTAGFLNKMCKPARVGLFNLGGFNFHERPERFPEWFARESKANFVLGKDAEDFTQRASRIATWDKKQSDNGKHDSATDQSSASKNGKVDQDLGHYLATYKPKTFGQIVQAVGDLAHLWTNWLVIGGLSLIYSKPKQGKTRIYIRIMKTLWFAEQWADGAANAWPAGTKTLILPYDRNHAEIAAEMKRMGIPDEAAVCPHDPRDATGVSLLSITDSFMIQILQKILAEDKAIKLLVIDTLTYASHKSLSKPEDMKAILDDIITLAIKNAVAVLVLIHENREGEALGRRICERARVLMKLERYNESDPSRLRLYVKDSNFPERPALTVVHRTNGIEFEKDQGQAGNGPDRCYACARFLVDYLWQKGVGVEVDFGTIIDALGNAGFAGTINTEHRWSDRKLFSRAIAALNDEVDALSDLKMHKVKRREVPRVGRSRPMIVYWLESENVPRVNDGPPY